MKRHATDAGNGPPAFHFSGSPGEQRRVEFAHTVRGLNTQFASWVQEQAAERGGELWLGGVEDYVKYARDLLSDYADVISQPGGAAKPAAAGALGPAGGDAPAPATSESPPARIGLQAANGHAPQQPFITLPPVDAKPPSFSLPFGPATGAADAGTPVFSGLSGLRPIATGKRGFGAPPASTAAAAPETSAAASLPPPATGSWFPAPSAPASGSTPSPAPWTCPAASGAFGSSAAPAGGFGSAAGAGGIGSAAATITAAATTGIAPAVPAFSWGGPSQLAPASGLATTPPASNGTLAAGVGGAAADGGGDDAEGDAPSEPYKSEVLLDLSEVEMLFKARSKLFAQSSRDRQWKDRGMGQLTLRRARGEGGRAYVVFTTESGRVLLNASLYTGMKIKEQAGKLQQVMMVLPVLCAETGEGGASGSPTRELFMFKLPSAERGQEFRDICTSNVPA